MAVIPYGRFNAIESALGGRENVEKAFQKGHKLVGVSHIIFPFTFDTPGLVDGVPFYEPDVGEWVMDHWLQIDEAWDGTLPSFDLGQFVSANHGWWYWATGAGASRGVPLEAAAADGAWPVPGQGDDAMAGSQLTSASLSVQINGVLGRFLASDPLKVVVSQDGTLGGAAPGSTHGNATAHLLTLPPNA